MRLPGRESKTAETHADRMLQTLMQARGIDGMSSAEPATRRRPYVGGMGDILLLHSIVTFRDADSGATLAGKIVGRTSEAEPKYDVRVGSKVYADIPAPRIGIVAQTNKSSQRQVTAMTCRPVAPNEVVDAFFCTAVRCPNKRGHRAAVTAFDTRCQSANTEPATQIFECVICGAILVASCEPNSGPKVISGRIPA